MENALEKVGLTAEECAFFCKDLVVEESFDENGNVIEARQIYNDDGTPKYIYSLRLEEYIAITVAKTKQVDLRCKSLEQRLATLEVMAKKG